MQQQLNKLTSMRRQFVVQFESITLLLKTTKKIQIFVPHSFLPSILPALNTKKSVCHLSLLDLLSASIEIEWGLKNGSMNS